MKKEKKAEKVKGKSIEFDLEALDARRSVHFRFTLTLTKNVCLVYF